MIGWDSLILEKFSDGFLESVVEEAESEEDESEGDETQDTTEGSQVHDIDEHDMQHSGSEPPEGDESVWATTHGESYAEEKRGEQCPGNSESTAMESLPHMDRGGGGVK